MTKVGDEGSGEGTFTFDAGEVAARVKLPRGPGFQATPSADTSARDPDVFQVAKI